MTLNLSTSTSNIFPKLVNTVNDICTQFIELIKMHWKYSPIVLVANKRREGELLKERGP